MIPKPKSEAWVLCALSKLYKECDELEDRSGNDNSPNSLKRELEELLGSYPPVKPYARWCGSPGSISNNSRCRASNRFAQGSKKFCSLPRKLDESPISGRDSFPKSDRWPANSCGYDI